MIASRGARRSVLFLFCSLLYPTCLLLRLRGQPRQRRELARAGGRMLPMIQLRSVRISVQ